MNEQPNDAAEQTGTVDQPAASTRGRAELRLIGMIFLLPLVLMFVTSIVCIAVVVARH
jgi:hypothetical protein